MKRSSPHASEVLGLWRRLGLGFVVRDIGIFSGSVGEPGNRCPLSLPTSRRCPSPFREYDVDSHPRPAIRPLWMAPALQEKSCRYGDLVGCSLLSGLLMQPMRDCWPWWGRRTRSQSAYQAMTPRTDDGLSLFPAWPVSPSLRFALTTSWSRLTSSNWFPF